MALGSRANKRASSAIAVTSDIVPTNTLRSLELEQATQDTCTSSTSKFLSFTIYSNYMLIHYILSICLLNFLYFMSLLYIFNIKFYSFFYIMIEK